MENSLFEPEFDQDQIDDSELTPYDQQRDGNNNEKSGGSPKKDYSNNSQTEV